MGDREYLLRESFEDLEDFLSTFWGLIEDFEDYLSTFEDFEDFEDYLSTFEDCED